MRNPGGAPEQFGHHAAGLDAARDRVAVLAIRREEVVVRRHRGHRADHGGFLAEVQVAVPTDLGPLVHLGGALFEPPDELHLAVVITEPVERFAGEG